MERSQAMQKKSSTSHRGGSSNDWPRFLPGFITYKWHSLLTIQIGTVESLIPEDYREDVSDQVERISEMRRAIGDCDPTTSSDHGLKVAVSSSSGGVEQPDGSMVSEFVVPTSPENLGELWICFLIKGWQPRIARRPARVVPDKDNSKLTWWSYKLSAILPTGDDDQSFKLRDEKSGCIWLVAVSAKQQEENRTVSTLTLTARKTKG